MSELATLANIAEIVGAGTIVTGVAFGWIQMRHYRAEQRNAVAAELTRTFYNRDLAQALALLHGLPDGMTLREFRAKGHEYEEAAVTVTTSFETMGVLVFKRIAPLELVVDLAGGIISTMSRKLQRFQEDLRKELDQPSWGEWFEWLGDQVARVKHTQPPAHVLHREWRP